jgi:glycerol-1-phosphate dehydrogenase [NAD(P)+]
MSRYEGRQVVCQEGSGERLARALRAASDTREVQIEDGAIDRTAEVFRRHFTDAAAVVIADRNTFSVAGRHVAEVIRNAGIAAAPPVVFEDADLYACSEHVERLQAVLSDSGAVPIAVGSGTINDLTKLAAHRSERPYLVVATAASMDGYTAFGASITHRGSKETFFCPAPRAVIADLDVICQAPAELNAAGYADLVAKITAGADWILADALGVEPIGLQAWDMVQGHLREWIADPEAVRRGERTAIQGLLEGLLMTGFAMQQSRSSRPASGAEHQFSHLWDMEHHRHQGRAPRHGCKVAVGTLAVTLLYEELLRYPLQLLDTARVCARHPDLEALRRQARELHALPELQEVVLREVEAKYLDRAALAEMLERLRDVWVDLRERLRLQLIPSKTLQAMLHKAGAPSDASEIGIDCECLRRSYVAAQQIRRRFTVLDVATLTGLMPECLQRLFDECGDGTGSGRTEECRKC